MSQGKQGLHRGHVLSSAINRVAIVGAVAAGVLLGAMVLIIGYEVIMRYVFRAPTIWVYEVSHYLLAAVMTWPLAYGVQRKAHIIVNAVVQRLPHRWQQWLVAVTSSLTVLAAFLFVWSAFVLRNRSLELKQTSWSLLQVPLALPQLAPVIGFSVFALMMVVTCWDKWREVASRDGRNDENAVEKT